MNESDRHHMSDWMDDRIEAYLDGDLPDEERVRFEAILQGDEEAHRQLRLAGLLRERLTEIDPPACPPDIADNVLAHIRADYSEDRVPLRRADRPTRSVPARLRRLAWPAMAAAIVAAAITAVLLTGRTPAGPDENEPIVVAEREPVNGPIHRDEAPGNEQVDPGTDTPEPSGQDAEPAPNATNPLDPPVLDEQLAAAEQTGPDSDPADTADLHPSSPEVQQALAEAKWTLAYISQIGRQTGRTIRQDVLHDAITEPMQQVLGSTLNVESNS